MARDELSARILDLSDQQFEKIAPCLEADLANVDGIDEVGAEIDATRRSAKTDPVVDHGNAFTRARTDLTKK